MIVRTLQDCENTSRSVDGGTWKSVRMLLADDQMGFSFHITTIYAGTETPIWYKNHLESVYCMKGEGEIETLSDGKVYPIRPGTLYILDQHDRHLLRATTSDMEMACVFNPPLNGREIHDKDGAYCLDQAPLGQTGVDA
ncbi:ectoine synthase [Parathalassolituus penaei]|uniref:L-ectoine synthase n=1 Tax=Parathalassolituus penaei TaxID=2997323 RepID=A0A9X3EE24_9GAMM|nr:ectoine synthase [Parathalassolituus penaei]MCY0964990.1 ectoine synthase [Parathalassolituus penaei]